MKKLVGLIALAIAGVACQQPKVEKTAFVDSKKLYDDYNAVKSIEEKLKSKYERSFKALDSMKMDFQRQAQQFDQERSTKSPLFLQKRGQELGQLQQQIQMIEQNLSQGYQREINTSMDSLFTELKKRIGEYAKKNNYAFVLGGGDANTVLYGKEEFDITEELLKELNGGADSSAVAKSATPEVAEEKAADSVAK